MASNWRANAFDWNFFPGDIIMAARVVAGPQTGRVIAYQPNPTSAAWTFIAGPNQLPQFVEFVPRNTPHFPYGYIVDPD